MSKKKIFLLVIACLLIVSASFGATYAFLIANDSVSNEFTIGENKIDVEEDYDPPEKLLPGTVITKKPSVKNTGNLSCFVRMRADFSDSRAREICEELDIDTENWEYDTSDGYYYYKKLLDPGQSTEYLFTKIVIRTEKDGSELTAADMIDFDVLVFAESCQHEDHDGECADNEYKTIWQ